MWQHTEATKGLTRANIASNLKENVAKQESHASSCNKCNFETKTKGKMADHMGKYRHQESNDNKSKTSADIM